MKTAQEIATGAERPRNDNGNGGGRVDCHIHMVLDGVDWRKAIARHNIAPEEGFVRRCLAIYRDRGYTYLRDGGDRWGVGALARDLAPEYGITYRTPGSPLCRKGHYGEFIGRGFESQQEYARLVKEQKRQGADFVKIMASGLMDFHRFGVVTDEPMESGLLRELVHIAHEEGMAVMVHANGAEVLLAAARAGVDSVEHGAYADREALSAMAEEGVVWVPTLSTVGNLLKQWTIGERIPRYARNDSEGRFTESVVRAILADTTEKVGAFLTMGGLVAPGTDAGAWAVPHCCGTEEGYLYAAGATEEDLKKGTRKIIEKF